MKKREAFAGRVAIQWGSIAERFSSVFLVLAAVSLIVVGRFDPAVVSRLRTGLADGLAPLLALAQRPIGTVEDAMQSVQRLYALNSENARLRAENARLSGWRSTALQLEAQNQVLRDMLNLRPGAPPVLKTEPVVGEPGGVYVRSVLISGGAHDGLAKGQAAMVGPGLVGRITEVGAWSARILLITDLNSRIPVILERSRTHAILAGDNTAAPVLHYLPKEALVSVGDRVVTAGHDGVFPRGLAVGRVASVANGEIRIAPLADLDRLEFVQIVDSTAASALTPEAAPAQDPTRFVPPQ